MGTICLNDQAVFNPIRRGKKPYSRETRRWISTTWLRENLADQHTRMQGFTAVYTVLCLLPHTAEDIVEAVKKRAEPYTRIVEELPETRLGEGSPCKLRA